MQNARSATSCPLHRSYVLSPRRKLCLSSQVAIYFLVVLVVVSELGATSENAAGLLLRMSRTWSAGLNCAKLREPDGRAGSPAALHFLTIFANFVL